MRGRTIGLTQKRLETGLDEMLIVGESGSQPLLFHDYDAGAVRELQSLSSRCR